MNIKGLFFFLFSGTKAVQESLRSYYKYRTRRFEHHQRVFEQYLTSSKMIFVVEVFLVAGEVFFYQLQFRLEIRGRKAGDNKGLSSILEASTQGNKVCFPVLGALILIISLLFLYPCLAHVQRTEEII